MKRSSSFFVLFVFLLLPLMFPPSSYAYYTNMPASVVVGQPNFTSNTANNGGISASSLNGPTRIATDGKRLFVADFTNNRVLMWNSIPQTSNTPADIVLGQPNFTSSTANNGGISASSLNGPTTVTSDGTRLVVGDRENNRVLIWNSIPTTNQQAADVVIGQSSFASTTTGTSQTTFSISGPDSIDMANGKLAVVDISNNRVLIYNSIPTTNGAAADVVIGQDNFNTSSSGVSQTRFSTNIRQVSITYNKLIVSDTGNNRVMIWNSIPTTNGTSADLVIGQPDFISNTADNGGITCSTLKTPQGIFLSSPNGRLIIGDRLRMLIFNQFPTSNFQSADIVIGQIDCTTRSTTLGVTNRSFATGRPVGEVNKQLLVGDANNNRLLIFSNQLPDTSFTNTLVSGIDNGLERFKGRATTNVVNGRIVGVEWSINGSDSWTGAFPSDGDFNESTEDYFFDFDPKSNNPDLVKNVGFTLRVRNSHGNTLDVSPASLYFEPFVASSPGDKTYTASSLPSFSFSINTWRFSDLEKDIDRFRVSLNKDNTGWIPYMDNIPVSYEQVRDTIDNLRRSGVPSGGNGIYEDKGKTVTYSNGNGTITVQAKAVDPVTFAPSDLLWDMGRGTTGGMKLPAGSYQWKVEAVDRANHVQATETRTLFVGRRQVVTSRSWFPLTINQISGVSQSLDISTVHPSDTLPLYATSSFAPTIGGIAFAGSTVTITKTDPSCTISSCTQTYQTTTGDTSRYAFTFPDNSFRYGVPYAIGVSVKDTGGNYNELPTFTLQVGNPP